VINKRCYGGIILAVLAMCLVLAGMRSRAEATLCLRSGGVDSGGGSSRSTCMLHSFIGQSTAIGRSQCTGIHLHGGMGYTIGIPGKVTAVCEDVTVGTAPEAYALYPNVPNPFNPTTVIKYRLPEEKNVTLAVYDILGRRVKTLVAQTQQVGYYSVTWNGCDDSGKEMAAGVYLYRLRVGSFAQTRKMVLIK